MPKPLLVLLRSRLEIHLLPERRIRSMVGALKAFSKPYTNKAYRYFVENLGKYALNFIMPPLNVSLDYIKVLRSSKRTDWAGLALMWGTYLKHVEEYVRNTYRVLAATTLTRR